LACFGQVSGRDVKVLPIPGGTPVIVSTLDSVSSRSVQGGDLVPIVVDVEVNVRGYVVIPEGLRGVAKVTAVIPAFGAIGGFLDLQPLYVPSYVPQWHIPLTGVLKARGGSHENPYATEPAFREIGDDAEIEPDDEFTVHVAHTTNGIGKSP
jgi:hypothetical protein